MQSHLKYVPGTQNPIFTGQSSFFSGVTAFTHGDTTTRQVDAVFNSSHQTWQIRLDHTKLQYSMKIFAKRTRTVVDPETAEKLRQEESAQKERDADKAVEELLKLDPSTLNSKQRRLIKRYKKRNVNPDELQVDEEKNELPKEAIRSDQDEKSASKETAKPVEQEEDAESSSKSSGSLSGSDDEEMDVSGNDALEAKDKPSGERIGSQDETARAPTNDNGGLDKDTVKKLLEKLNSKQRRKLMRRLEREGSSVSNEIHEEALNLLKESEKSLTSDTAAESKSQQETENTVSGKKRKKDWGDLPPEERLRREEQRQMQQEAAARRAKDPASKRHPLNSERRRANRRKPKWERKRPVENEHNLSGYHMRRLKQAGEI